MNKRVAAFFVLVSLIASSTNFAAANFVPRETPPPSVVINSDGTVQGTNIRYSDNVYTFTGDIHGTVVVTRNDIVLDGAGYSLQGNGDYTGILLQDKSNVTIRNMNIRGFRYGIDFTHSYNAPDPALSNTISGNTLTDNTYGIYIGSEFGNYVISENYFANNTNGLSIAASGNLFRNNNFENNQYSILDNTDGTNDMDTSNIVNGKPVYYWANQHDRTVPSNAGFVALKNCRNITVQKLKLEGNGEGILLYNTNDSTITENVFTNNLEGLTLKESNNNLIFGNNITGNQGNGIGISANSNVNNVSRNEVTDNGKDGVNVESSVRSSISENSIVNNAGSGIFFNTIQDSNVIGNNITLNHGYGIEFMSGPNGTVKGNYLLKNQEGMLIKAAFENTVTLNTITESNSWCIDIQADATNNTIYRNNFINNKITDGLQVYIGGFWTFPAAPNYYDLSKPPKFIPGAFNAWDDSKEGNYWSDYTTRYPNVTEIGNSGIGDTAFSINANNVDRYPLMKPFNISFSSTPTPEPSKSSSSPSATPIQSTLPTQSPTASPQPTSSPEPSATSTSATELILVTVTAVTAFSVAALAISRCRKRQV